MMKYGRLDFFGHLLLFFKSIAQITKFFITLNYANVTSAERGIQSLVSRPKGLNLKKKKKIIDIF